MSKIFNTSKLKKFITPKDVTTIFSYIDSSIDNKLKYKIETGHFSKNNPEKSIGIFYIDIEKRKIAGMVFFYVEKQILADLETFKEYRNNGIGTKLTEDAISLGAKYLAVDDNNKIAINIYKKCGFKEYYYDVNKKLSYMSIDGKPHPDDVKIIKK